MSTKVVPAPADQAKQPVRSEKLAKQSEEQKAVQDKDERLADDDSEEEVSVAEVEESQKQESSLATDFTFSGALAEAAAASGSLIAEAEEADVSFGNYGEGGSEGTVLLVGAVLLVGIGIAALASGGDSDDPADDVPLNEDPTVSADVADVTLDEDGASGAITVTTDDADGDAVTVTGSADNGTVTDNGDGTFTYSPNADFNGADTITFTADDGNGGTATTTVAATVNPVADAPAFDADSIDVTATEDTPLDGDVSGNASDADGDSLTFALASGAANGVAVVNADGTFTYTPAQDSNAADSFDVSVDDGNGGTDTVTVNVTVTPVNDAPEFPSETADVGTTVDTPFVALLAATDVDGDALTFGLESDATSGTATVAADGTVTYTPNAGFVGTDSFVVNVDDGNGGTDTATVNVDVTDGPALNVVSIDNTPETAGETVPATADIDVFSDDAESFTDVVITGFNASGEGDTIAVTNAAAGDYFFGTGTDPNDLRITFNDGANFTEIILDDVLVGFEGFVFNLQSATDALGYDFITFG